MSEAAIELPAIPERSEGPKVPSEAEGRAIAVSTLWQVGSQVMMAALSIITTKFVAMGLSKEFAGFYNTAYGYLQLFGILADFGLYAVAVREVSRAPAHGAVHGHNRENVLGALIVLRLLILAVSLGSALLVAWLTPHWRGTPLPLGITVAAFVPALTLAAGIVRTVFQVEHRMQYVFIAEVTQRVITVALTGLFLAAGVRESGDERVYLAFLVIGGLGALELLITSLAFARKFFRLRPRWDTALLKHLFLQAAPYGLAFLCTALYRQFDITLIARLRPYDFELQNAYYGFVQRMLDMAYLLPTFLLNSALPALAHRDGRGEDTRSLLGKVLLAILLLSSVNFLFAFLWPRPLVALLVTKTYLSTAAHPGSDTALHLLAASMFWNGIVVYGFYVLLTRHRWKPLVSTLALGVVLSLFLNINLIPSLGFVGAAITSIVVHTVLALLLLPQALRTMPVRLTLDAIGRWLLFSLFLAIALFLLHPFATAPLRTILLSGIVGLWMAGLLWGLGLAQDLFPSLASRKSRK